VDGFLGGLYWAHCGRPAAAIKQRGKLVFDGNAARRATRRLRSQAGRRAPGPVPLTVASIAVPSFVELFNLRHAVVPANPTDAFRPVLHSPRSSIQSSACNTPRLSPRI
jgi:hypothetical protein